MAEESGRNRPKRSVTLGLVPQGHLQKRIGGVGIGAVRGTAHLSVDIIIAHFSRRRKYREVYARATYQSRRTQATHHLVMMGCLEVQ